MVRGQGTPLPWLRVSLAGTRKPSRMPALRLSHALPLHLGLPHLQSEAPSGLLDAPLTRGHIQSVNRCRCLLRPLQAIAYDFEGRRHHEHSNHPGNATEPLLQRHPL
jgi:hypothetical protein